MRPFDYEIATQKLRQAMDASGLSLEEKRELLLEMLNDTKGLSSVGEQGRRDIADAVLRGDSVLFVDGQNVNKEGLSQLADSGKAKVNYKDGSTMRSLDGIEDLDVNGYVTVIQPAEDSLKGTTTFGRSKLSPESAAMMVHQHLDVNRPNSVKAFAKRDALVASVDKKQRSPGEQFYEETLNEWVEFLEQKPAHIKTKEDAKAALREFAVGIVAKYAATDGQLRYMQEVYDLELRYDDLETTSSLRAAWAAAAEYVPTIREYIEEFERKVSRIYWPPKVDTASTLEATLMSVSYSWSSFYAKTFTEWTDASDGQVIGNLLGVLATNGHPKVRLFVEKIEPLKKVDNLADFGMGWLESNFAKLEVSHKLAASLCLTDVPDDLEVKAPWKHWSFVIPDGLLAPAKNKNGELEGYARVFCEGSAIRYLVSSTGRCVGPVAPDQTGAPEQVLNLFKLLNSLVKGACLALSDPEQYKKQSLSKNEGSFKKTKRSGGAPELNNARYMLSAPVQVDLRDVVHAVQRGERRRGGKLTVQFLVRGHWKNQVHGEKRALRKRIWIQPFWKGGEETRVLLRNYIVKDAEERTEDGQSNV